MCVERDLEKADEGLRARFSAIYTTASPRKNQDSDFFVFHHVIQCRNTTDKKKILRTKKDTYNIIKNSFCFVLTSKYIGNNR